MTSGGLQSISTAPPSHYIVKIESFSVLTKNFSEAGYESGEFEAGGYKWKLILHPKGNKNTNVKNYISLYLMMVVNDTSLRLGSDVNAILRVFLFNQKKADYLVIQDSIRRFDRLKHEWGFDRLISLKDFQNSKKGYLVGDTCVFGAEVFISQKTEKVDSLSMVKSRISYTHTWKIENFSKQDAKFIESTTFTIGDQKWKIRMYPKGKNEGADTDYISFYLYLADTSVPPGSPVYAEFALRILNSDYKEKLCFKTSDCAWGLRKFIPLRFIQSKIKNNCFIVEADVTVYGDKTAL